MPDASSPAVSGARPSVVIAGKADDTLTGSLLSLEIVETEEGLYRCDLQFGNWGGQDSAGFQHFKRDQLEFGKALQIKLGDALMFDGRISAIRASFPEGGPPQIGVAAEDRLQELRMTRRTRCFAQSSVADVVNRIAQDHGLQADVKLDAPTLPLIAQLNQSDLAFLRDLLRRVDGQIWADGTQLRVASFAQRSGGELELAWAGKLRSFEVVADLAQQCTALTAGGWDVSGKQAATHKADRSAIAAELDGGQSAMEILPAALGERAETIAHGVAGDAAQAQALAEAALRLRARRFVVGRGVAETSKELRVGARLKIKGVGPLFEGSYFVTEVRHRFDAKKGARSEFCCGRAAIGRGGSA